MALFGVFDLFILIERMNATTPLTKEDQVAFREEASERLSVAFDRLFDAGPDGVDRITSADWMPPTAFAPEGSDNNLREQVDTLSRNFHTWISTGQLCPPAAAWRIAVILSKAKEADLEKAFLKAWCRHFRRIKGGRFADLVERAKKKRAVR